MARDRAAEAARRDAKARAAGFTSYGQQYRANKAGFRAGGEAWNATLDARKSKGLQRLTTNSMLGYTSTAAGIILSVWVADGEDVESARPLQIAINRFGPRRRAQVTFSPDNGNPHAYARFGGIKVGQIQGDPDDPPILDYVVEQEAERYEDDLMQSGVITVVIR